MDGRLKVATGGNYEIKIYPTQIKKIFIIIKLNPPCVNDIRGNIKEKLAKECVVMNTLIVQRIKAARIERELTQKDLASHLGKTSAAISDLERGKVQVSASDLHSISKFLNKPIEYFYGEEIGDKEIENLTAVLRKQPKETRDGTIQLTNMLLQMQEIQERADLMPKDEEVPIDQITEFYQVFVPFSVIISEMSKQLKDLRNKFDKELKDRGVDLSDKL